MAQNAHELAHPTGVVGPRPSTDHGSVNNAAVINGPFGLSDPEALAARAYRNLAGYGPLERLLDDEDVWEIMINAPDPASNVPGSYATYTKMVDPQGSTVTFYKTTYAPDGSVVHVNVKYP